MSYDAFAKVTDIDGESTAKGFEKCIGIYSFSLSGNNPASVDPGRGGMSASRVSYSDFSFMKQSDSATCKLHEAMCKGKHIKEVVITLRKATGSEQEGFLIYTFSDCMVSSVSTSGGTGGDDRPSESVSLCAAKIGIEYKVQGKDGKLKQAGLFEWDLTAVA